MLSADTIAVGVDITILDPELDETEEYTRNFVVNFCEAFNAVREGLKDNK